MLLKKQTRPCQGREICRGTTLFGCKRNPLTPTAQRLNAGDWLRYDNAALCDPDYLPCFQVSPGWLKRELQRVSFGPESQSCPGFPVEFRLPTFLRHRLWMIGDSYSFYLLSLNEEKCQGLLSSKIRLTDSRGSIYNKNVRSGILFATYPQGYQVERGNEGQSRPTYAKNTPTATDRAGRSYLLEPQIDGTYPSTHNLQTRIGHKAVSSLR